MDYEPSQDLGVAFAGPEVSRLFTEGRHRQGFRDQAHLDAFYRYYDHVKAGPASGCGCGTPGQGYDGPDGWQPTENLCGEAQRLLEASR
jgi:hypothetical protein